VNVLYNNLVGYNPGEQHVGKSKIDSREDNLPPQAGTHGQPDSHVSGQTGPEIMGGKFYVENYILQKFFFFSVKGSASTRVIGQSVDEQLKNPLPPKSGE